MMMSLVAALAYAAPAPTTPPLASQAQAVKAAQCLIRRDRQASRRLAAAIPGTAEEAAAYADVETPLRGCFAKSGLSDTGANRAIVAGAVAERLYVSTTRSFESRTVSGPTPAPEALASLDQAIARRTKGWAPEAAVADCLVMRKPNESDRLLRTSHGSSAEAAALEQFIESMPGCLNKGEEVRLSRPRLRAELARGFYRYIYQPFHHAVAAKLTGKAE
jgi:hypothetical protein